MTEPDIADEVGLASVRRGLIDLVSQLGTTPSAIRITTGAVSIEVEWHANPAAPETNGHRPGVPIPTAEPEPGGEPEPPDTALHHIRAQTVGAFYRSPAPGQPPFVNVGDLVSPGQQVAILEAMKIMIPVEADCHGRVVEVLPDDATHVEYDQPLLAIAPIAA